MQSRHVIGRRTEGRKGGLLASLSSPPPASQPPRITGSPHFLVSRPPTQPPYLLNSCRTLLRYRSPKPLWDPVPDQDSPGAQSLSGVLALVTLDNCCSSGQLPTRPSAPGGQDQVQHIHEGPGSPPGSELMPNTFCFIIRCTEGRARLGEWGTDSSPLGGGPAPSF